MSHLSISRATIGSTQPITIEGGRRKRPRAYSSKRRRTVDRKRDITATGQRRRCVSRSKQTTRDEKNRRMDDAMNIHIHGFISHRPNHIPHATPLLATLAQHETKPTSVQSRRSKLSLHELM